MKKLIKNAMILDMVLDKPNIKKGDILINGNTIEKIDSNILDNADEVIDAKGMLVMPGLINTHTHLAMAFFRGYKDDLSLMDWLNNAIFPVEDKMELDDVYNNSCLSLVEMLKSGTTCINDMYFMSEKTVEALEKTGMRGVVSWCLTDNSIGDKLDKTKEYAKKYNNDNSRISIYVAAHAPYTCNPDTIETAVNLAKELNTPLHIHLSETNDEENTIQERYDKSATKYLKDLNVFDVPVILAHSIHMSESDVELLKNIKGGISHNPISNAKLASGICDVVNLRKKGIAVGLGTDGAGSTTTLDLFEEMRLCAYLQKLKNNDPTAIKAYDVLKMATIEGAKVLGLDDKIGTIEVGKRADLIFIDIKKLHLWPENDICTNLVYSANGSDVNTVIIDGNVLMKDRQLVSINEEELMKKVKESADKLL